MIVWCRKLSAMLKPLVSKSKSKSQTTRTRTSIVSKSDQSLLVRWSSSQERREFHRWSSSVAASTVLT